MAANLPEFSGRLKERVRIERRLEAGNENGGPGDDWTTIGTAWAQVQPVSRTALSEVQAETRLTARVWRVTIRSEYRVQLDMRLVWRRGLLRVVGIEDDPALPDRLVVLAEEFGP